MSGDTLVSDLFGGQGDCLVRNAVDSHIAGYWTVSGSCISAWSTGSTLLDYGLSPPQAIGTVVCTSRDLELQQADKKVDLGGVSYWSPGGGLWLDG